ncbi:hypothetical protein MRX96_047276 [Rhipicephalus microplus]
MMARDLNSLFTLLRRFNYEILLGLTVVDFVDSFSIAIMTKEHVIDEVRTYLQGVEVVEGRLYCMAGLHCWLACPNNVLSPWGMYLVDPAKGEFVPL